MSMALKSIDVVVLFVADLERAKAFYSESPWSPPHGARRYTVGS
jgi:catechol 2,3-dioxygenase-like lactoylglutathione lyase family enzyme